MWRSPKATALNRSLAALAVLGFAASTASAQTTAVICGTVTDATAGLMPGVSVTLERDAVPPLNAVTDKEGDYLFTNVSLGTYRMTFWQDGFKKAVRIGITLTAGWSQRVDQRMSVATPEEFVASPAPPSVAYDRPARTGSSFTKDNLTAIPTERAISTGRAVAPRPCKIEK